MTAREQGVVVAFSIEVQGMVALVRSFGLPHRVTDVNTPGVHSASGYHYKDGTGGNGLAIDLAWTTPYAIDPIGARVGMLAICKALEPYERQMAELICSHLPYSVKDGRRVPRYAVSSHWDHIHMAVSRTTCLTHIAIPTEVIVVPDDPNIPNITGPIEFHPVINHQTGECRGYYLVSLKTGEIHAWGPGAVYYGRSEVVA